MDPKRPIALLLALIVCAAFLCVSSFADFGDFGGDNDFGDFGGGDWDGGGDWGWDDDDDDGGVGFFGFGDYGGGSDGGGSSTAGWLPTIVVILAIIALIVWGSLSAKKKGSGGGKVNGQNIRINVGDRSTPQEALRPLSEYAAIDPAFSAAELREKASNLFVRMQNGWTAGDISDLRPYFTDALFTQFERQLAQKKAQGLKNVVERISVQNVVVRGFRQESGLDHMILRLEARFVDYTLDAAGSVVSGSRDREKFMTYEWDMCRTTGFETLKKDGIGRIFCPSCGAPLDINVSARCEYCDSVITSSEHDWAICAITALSQITV